MPLVIVSDGKKQWKEYRFFLPFGSWGDWDALGIERLKAMRRSAVNLELEASDKSMRKYYQRVQKAVTRLLEFIEGTQKSPRYSERDWPTELVEEFDMAVREYMRND